ncbi:MAG: hypothetical protein JXJ20_08510 [Anaerolineae bacterium]|nr:hypothetical protein [Anaerolineae bacterium]
MLAQTYRIGEIVFRVESDILFTGHVVDRLRQFEVDDTSPDVFCRLHRVDPVDSVLPPLRSSEIACFPRCVCAPSYSPDCALLRTAAVRARLLACLSHPDWVSLELSSGSATILDFIQREFALYYTPAYNFSSHYLGVALFAPFLTIFSAVAVHSSSLVRDGTAALFVAPDEGGKTTAATLSPTGTILCDDQNILRKDGDSIFVHSTPWGRHTSGPQQARLGGIFLLEQALDFEMIPIRPVDALEFLWNEHLSYYSFLPNKLKTQAFNLFYDACCQVPVYRLHFTKDYIDWDAVHAAMVRTPVAV